MYSDFTEYSTENKINSSENSAKTRCAPATRKRDEDNSTAKQQQQKLNVVLRAKQDN
jgi:hypothetical protein